MTEILFYHLDRQPLEKVLPTLLEKSLERGWRVVVQAASKERIEALDAQLWTFSDDSFLPHGTVHEPQAQEQRWQEVVLLFNQLPADLRRKIGTENIAHIYGKASASAATGGKAL